VRLESLVRISDKAFRATAFDGSTDIIPASQIKGQDHEVSKCDAYWISAWILEKKSLQYSNKKQAWFDEQGRRLPTYTVERHTPERITPTEHNKISELKRC
jgi:hypothetical protein